MTARSLLAAVLLLPSLALGSLRDHGPVDPLTGIPTWYRDTSATALEPCLAQTPSPNAAAGGAPLCFPIVPDPAGFPGNFGAEAFYQSASALLVGATGVSARLDLALEASYALGTPIRGDEIVFGRIRIRVDVTVPGTYTVTHPFGVEIFPNVQPGIKAINFTQDIGIAPGLFEGALASRIGPFLQWDQLLPGETLTIKNPDGTVAEEYVGDPNYPHTVAGSPFGTNFFRIDGPVGSNLDGAGNSFMLTPVFNVLGKKYLTPIPGALALTRVTYARDAAGAQLDVFANADAGRQLIVSGAGMSPANMRGDGLGKYYAHVDFAADAILPGTVTVTNTNDVPPSTKSTGVTDLVFVQSAIYDVSTGLLTVSASTSDRSAAPPLLNALGIGALVPGAQPGTGSTTLQLASGVPPASVVVVSSAGGQDVGPVDVIVSAPVVVTPPVALDDAIATDQNAAVVVPVMANDVVVSPATFAALRLLRAPAHGTAAVSAADPTAFAYTPAVNFFGVDTFTYAVEDSTGALSNEATVTVTVNRLSIAPVAANDTASTRLGTAVVIRILANDTAANGTLDPLSVVLATAPTLGSAVVDGTGQVIYTPRTAGTDTFTYTVRDSFGVVSNTATVTVTVLSSLDVLTAIRVQFTVKKGLWRIDGTSNVFGPGITNSVRIHNGATLAAPVIATVPISATGAFTFQGAGPAPDTTQLVTLESTGGGVLTSVVAFR